MEKNQLLVALGVNIKLIRESKKLSQTDLAYKIGKDQPSINRLEKGRINPSYLYLKEVADGLEISINDLLI